MIRKFARFAILTGLTLTATAASAQTTGRIKFQPRPTPGVTAHGYYVGPFYGTLLSDPTRPRIDLYCVDVLNSITWNHTWNANFTSLLSGDYANTRHGAAKKDKYIKAAWLAEQYSMTSTTQWGGIQTAIWNLLNPGNPNGGTNVSLNTTEAYWLNAVSSWYSNPLNVQNFSPGKWTIVTQTTAAGLGQGGGTQEFLTTGITPEPETWALMGTGLILIVGFAVKRGRLV
ncbi:MAG: PEP-CTERM sorting domain-containing protein [Gemmatimonadota bacterium]